MVSLSSGGLCDKEEGLVYVVCFGGGEESGEWSVESGSGKGKCVLLKFRCQRAAAGRKAQNSLGGGPSRGRWPQLFVSLRFAPLSTPSCMRVS